MGEDQRVRVKDLREQERSYSRLSYHPDFDVVGRGEENLFIVSQGARSGTVLTNPEDYNHFTDAHIFIRTRHDGVVQNFIDLQTELKEIANVTARVRGCGLAKVVDAYTRRYGRPNSLEV